MSKGAVRRKSVINNNTNITIFAFDFGPKGYIENIAYEVFQNLSNTYIPQNILVCKNILCFSNLQYVFR